MRYAVWTCYSLTAERKAALDGSFAITPNGIGGWEHRHYKDGALFRDMPVVCHEDINAAYRWINTEEQIRPQQTLDNIPLSFTVKEYCGG